MEDVVAQGPERQRTGTVLTEMGLCPEVREPFKQEEVMVGSEFQEDHFGGDTEKEVNGGKQRS